ncbi:unnamed protein product [Scytosiphon promiscuus]
MKFGIGALLSLLISSFEMTPLYRSLAQRDQGKKAGFERVWGYLSRFIQHKLFWTVSVKKKFVYSFLVNRSPTPPVALPEQHPCEIEIFVCSPDATHPYIVSLLRFELWRRWLDCWGERTRIPSDFFWYWRQLCSNICVDEAGCFGGRQDRSGFTLFSSGVGPHAAPVGPFSTSKILDFAVSCTSVAHTPH